MTEEEIAHIIETALPKLRRAGVTTEKGTGGRQSAGRTNSLAWLPHDTTRTVHNVITKIAAVVGIPPENAESLQVIRYEMGQRYNKKKSYVYIYIYTYVYVYIHTYYS